MSDVPFYDSSGPFDASRSECPPSFLIDGRSPADAGPDSKARAREDAMAARVLATDVDTLRQTVDRARSTVAHHYQQVMSVLDPDGPNSSAGKRAQQVIAGHISDWGAVVDVSLRASSGAVDAYLGERPEIVKVCQLAHLLAEYGQYDLLIGIIDDLDDWHLAEQIATDAIHSAVRHGGPAVARGLVVEWFDADSARSVEQFLGAVETIVAEPALTEIVLAELEDPLIRESVVDASSRAMLFEQAMAGMFGVAWGHVKASQHTPRYRDMLATYLHVVAIHGGAEQRAWLAKHIARPHRLNLDETMLCAVARGYGQKNDVERFGALRTQLGDGWVAPQMAFVEGALIRYGINRTVLRGLAGE